MKVAFHFDCNNISELYDRYFYKLIFRSLLGLDNPFISSKIFVGDLLMRDQRRKMADDKVILAQLFSNDLWVKVEPENVSRLLNGNTFVVCFETLQKEIIQKLHDCFLIESRYLGALEIDDSIPMHWVLYQQSLLKSFRIVNKILYVIVDNDEVESQSIANDHIDFFRQFLFEEIKVEFGNYRYAAFDEKDTYHNAKRTVEWKKQMDSLFSTITDEIISKLMDTAPDLADKLWSITDTFNNAKTGEQFAQAMTSCRRVFEYVIDQIFPPTDSKIDGHSLGEGKYKNRLFEFAKQHHKSETNVNLVVSTISTLFHEWENLNNLMQKGVHDDPLIHECRRCILRTVLLFDDLIALKGELFQTQVKMDNYINKLVEKYKK